MLVLHTLKTPGKIDSSKCVCMALHTGKQNVCPCFTHLKADNPSSLVWPNDFVQTIVVAILNFGQNFATLFLPQFLSNRFEI